MKMGERINVAILGAGNIAGDMSKALSGIADEVNMYAVASRSYEKAKAFADKWGYETAYGSYEELVKDEKVDLIYIATPHSEHYKNAMLCLENGRNCLVEKPFCVNYTQAKEVIDYAEAHNLYVAEAMWTRYQPSKEIIKDIINTGRIGKVKYIEADFSVPLLHVERMINPSLAGGSLLDLGVYSLTVPAMYEGNDVVSSESTMVMTDTGVDGTTEVDLTYKSGVKAHVKSSCIDDHSNYAKICADNGYVVFGPINVPTKVEIFDNEDNLIETIIPEIKVNGYEYEVLESKEAIAKGLTEPWSMPHEETLRIMGWMDSIRKKHSFIYPFEKEEDVSEGKL